MLVVAAAIITIAGLSPMSAHAQLSDPLQDFDPFDWQPSTGPMRVTVSSPAPGATYRLSRDGYVDIPVAGTHDCHASDPVMPYGQLAVELAGQTLYFGCSPPDWVGTFGFTLRATAAGLPPFDVYARAGSHYLFDIRYETTFPALSVTILPWKDEAPPNVTIASPAGEPVLSLGQKASARFSCSDEEGGSGIDTCEGSVADGAQLDTSTVGEKEFTVVARDKAGNRTSVTHRYTVEGRLTAVGDSVSAGEGLADGWQWSWNELKLNGRWVRTAPRFDWDETFTTAFCHQTPGAHPRIVAMRLETNVTHLACTGATARNGVLNPRLDEANGNQQVAERQLDSDYDASKPDIVTLSLGANDVEFSDIGKECVLDDCTDEWEADCGVASPRSDCIHLDARLATQTSGLETVLTEIRRRGGIAEKTPLIAITQYNNPFPHAWSEKCPEMDLPLHFTLSKREIDLMARGLARLNESIARTAERYDNVVVVPPSEEMAQHPWCSPDPWTYGVSIAMTIDGIWEGTKTPFHPTPIGQRAIADTLTDVLESTLSAAPGNSLSVTSKTGPKLNFDKVTAAGSIVAAPLPLDALAPTGRFKPRKAWEIASSVLTEGTTKLSLPAQPDESIWHLEGGSWTKLPTTYADGFATAEVSGFSPFAVGPDVAEVDARVTAGPGGQAPHETSFDASASSVDGGGAIASYEWDFGDGQTGTGATPTHRFEQSGSYDVSVRVTSAAGATDDASVTVEVTNPGPTAVIDAPAGGVTDEELALEGGRSADGNGRVVESSWDFGDGTAAASGPSATHAWKASGTYTVTLFVHDDEGATGTATRQVVIADPPAQPPGSGGEPSSSPSPGPLGSSPAPVPGRDDSPIGPVPPPFLAPLPAPGAVQPPVLGRGTVTLGRPKLARNGRAATVAVGCGKAGAACSGRVLVRDRRRKTLGKAKFSLKPGRTTKLTIKFKSRQRTGSKLKVVVL